MSVSFQRELTLKVGAKLNLYLAVVGRRGNYHLLETVFQSIDLYDKITIRVEGEGIKLKCVGIEAGEDNLAYRSALAFKEAFGIKEGISIELEKGIPVARGLGGGSADAGGVLLALSKLFSIPRENLLPIASSLGADVSFFLYGGCAIGRGIGDIIEPLPFMPRFRFLLIIPPFPISTSLAYSRLEPPFEPSNLDKFIEALEKSDIIEVEKFMRNDLEKAVFPLFPELKEVKEELRERGYPTLMTGSGSALFSFLQGEPPTFQREGWQTIVVNPTPKAVVWS
ncbi:4-(cytidine 5'-diphospho)-2-C-methyl-D-erythritol kinase [bacterium]|nr:4-(cytidine 5'-diphospho)-2-C-methyl-D-erythritol kinase [bacterium]